MKKILLVIEDYADQTTFENLLRRLGFDCLAVTRDARIGDALLSFTPELVFLGGMGKNIDIKRAAIRIAKMNPKPPIAALKRNLEASPGRSAYQAIPPEVQNSFDALVELPVQPIPFIKMICKMTNLSEAPVIDKYEKLTQGQTGGGGSAFRSEGKPKKQEPSMVLKSGQVMPFAPGESIHVRTERSDKYDQFLVSHSPKKRLDPQAKKRQSNASETRKDLQSNDPKETQSEGQAQDQELAYLNDPSDLTDEYQPQETHLSREKSMAASRKLAAAAKEEAKEIESIDAEKRNFVKALFRKP
jgi:CheY-like chemotaxis protein